MLIHRFSWNEKILNVAAKKLGQESVKANQKEDTRSKKSGCFTLTNLGFDFDFDFDFDFSMFRFFFQGNPKRISYRGGGGGGLQGVNRWGGRGGGRGSQWG